MKQLWLSCSGNRARRASAVMPVRRLCRLLETGRSPHSYLHCSFLVGLMVFGLCRSPRGVRDDGRSLGNPSKMDFSPRAGRAVGRKGCAVPESFAGSCRHRGWEAPSRAGTPLPAPRCPHPAARTPLPAPRKAPELPARPPLQHFPQQSAAPGNRSVCICLQPAQG